MLVSGIKSKPVYAPLSADTRGRHHLMLALGAGGGALARTLRELETAAPDSLHHTRILFVDDPATFDASDTLGRFGRLALAGVQSFGSVGALLTELRSVLEHSSMGLRLYVAGPEHFIGRTLQIALEFNLNKDEIRAEEMGTLARRVHCVHCRTTTEDVRTNIVPCAGCGRWLLVRDHYSRRLAAYMGVMVDAEAPGERPPVQVVFP